MKIVFSGCRCSILKVITCNKGERTQAGKSGNINLHQMQAVAELHDSMQPVPKRPLALQLVQNNSVAERQFSVIRVRAVSQSQHEQLQRSGLKKQVFVIRREFLEAGYFLGEVPYDVDGGGEKGVKLLDFFCFGNDWFDRTRFAVLGIV